jgi:hypothetical protein
MMRRHSSFLAVCVLIATLCFSAAVSAHKASDAYLVFSDTGAVKSDVTGPVPIKFSMALRDFDVGNESLDANNDRKVSWGEIRQSLPQLQTWIAGGVTILCGTRAVARPWIFETLEERSDGVYLQFATSFECDLNAAVTARYTLLKELDATHRLLVGGVLQGNPIASVLTPKLIPVELRNSNGNGNGNAETNQSGWSAFTQFFPEGVRHLATGYDHLAFLLALILPLQLNQRRAGIAALVRTITAFTIGHSITLALATLGLVVAPTWVEPAIAISIGASALLNLYPVRWLRADLLALAFGLIHGLGFSTLMREANVSAELLPWALAGFNVGVEAGQLMAVALWVCIYWLLLQGRSYQTTIIKVASWGLLALAAFWTMQRVSS